MAGGRRYAAARGARIRSIGCFDLRRRIHGFPVPVEPRMRQRVLGDGGASGRQTGPFGGVARFTR
ncbi:hypothetical protein GCM10023403_46420 [Pseudonocardia benzenivorans]